MNARASHPSNPVVDASRFFVLAFATFFLFTVFSASPAWSCWGRSRHRANLRACFANQKTIAGAVEMYQLDYDVHQMPGGKLTDANWEKLRSDGYLQSIPDDPGFGPGTRDHYLLVPGASNGIVCLEHGTIQPPEGTSRDPFAQLVAMGVRDTKVLSRASRDRAHDRTTRRTPGRTARFSMFSTLFATAPFLSVTWSFFRALMFT